MQGILKVASTIGQPCLLACLLLNDKDDKSNDEYALSCASRVVELFFAPCPKGVPYKQPLWCHKAVAMPPGLQLLTGRLVS